MAISLLNAGPSTTIAQSSDLNYELVTPGAWAFSGSDVQSGHTYTIDAEKTDEHYMYLLKDNGTQISQVTGGEDFETEVDFGAIGEPSVDIVATVVGDSLPGYLLDRANNLVDASTGNVTLTLPEYENGKVRDLLVKVSVPSSVTSFTNILTWQGQGDEAPSQTNELKFMTEDGTFPTITEAGNYLFSLTEVEHHVFAISMKSLVNASQS